MSPFTADKTADKMMNILNQNYDFKIFKILDFYFDFDNSYMAFIYWKTEKELSLITDDAKKQIKEIFINYLKDNGYFPSLVKDVDFHFDSDENVQKNFRGNYFYATR